MKKLVFALVALSLAGVAAPTVASAHSGHKMHRHCHIVKKKVRVHHHWVWRHVKVCH